MTLVIIYTHPEYFNLGDLHHLWKKNPFLFLYTQLLHQHKNNTSSNTESLYFLKTVCSSLILSLALLLSIILFSLDLPPFWDTLAWVAESIFSCIPQRVRCVQTHLLIYKLKWGTCAIGIPAWQSSRESKRLWTVLLMCWFYERPGSPLVRDQQSTYYIKMRVNGTISSPFLWTYFYNELLK